MSNEQTRKPRLIAALVALAMLLELLPLAALQAWADSGEIPEGATEVVTSDEVVTWTGGTKNAPQWYVVSGEVEISGRITVNGFVGLWLAEGSTLTASSGITVSSSKSLTIDGTGTLIADAGTYSGSAIGGAYSSDCGAITINGGTIKVSGGNTDESKTAAIGISGMVNSPSCAVTITGGTVIATSPTSTIYAQTVTIGGDADVTATSTGIMNTMGAIKAKTVTITDGTVNATGTYSGIYLTASSNTALSPEYNMNLTISGGTVTATGGVQGYGIGSASRYGDVTITGGTVNATGGYNSETGATGTGAGIYVDGIAIGTENSDNTESPEVTVNGGQKGAINVKNNIRIYSGKVNATTMATDASYAAIGGDGSSNTKILLSGGEVNAVSNGKGGGIGYSTTYGAIEIDGGIVKATSVGGVAIGSGGTGTTVSITINGGEVTAISGVGAGIGNANNATGTAPSNQSITINGGNVTATGGAGGAGIGGGAGSTVKSIAINGGTVTAIGSNGGAGIGGANCSAGGNITISGGTVTATGSNGGADIGDGNGKKNGSTFTTTTTDTDGNEVLGNAVIFASSISDNDNTSAWSGVIFQGDKGTIYPASGSFTLAQDLTIPEGKTLTISEEQILTVQNDATLIVADGATLAVDSLENITIEEGGTIEVQPGATLLKGSASGGQIVDADSDELPDGWIILSSDDGSEAEDGQTPEDSPAASTPTEQKQGDDNAKQEADDGGAVLLAAGAVAAAAVVGGVLWLRSTGRLPNWFNKAAKLGGVAMDEAGNVLQNATILVQQLQEGQFVTVQTTTADANGNYKITVPDGDYVLTAQYTDPLTGEARTVELNISENEAA